MFTIGLTLLESATLVDCNRLYERRQGYYFVREGLEEMKAALRGRYSEELVGYICRMLEVNPGNRVKASRVFGELQVYESEILNLEEFEIRGAAGQYQGGPGPSSHIRAYNQSPPHSQYPAQYPTQQPHHAQPQPQHYSYILANNNNNNNNYLPQVEPYRPSVHPRDEPPTAYYDKVYAPVQSRIPPVSSNSYQQGRPY